MISSLENLCNEYKENPLALTFIKLAESHGTSKINEVVEKSYLTSYKYVVCSAPLILSSFQLGCPPILLLSSSTFILGISLLSTAHALRQNQVNLNEVSEKLGKIFNENIPNIA